jgi:uncharacterized Zn finger protein (UPF0148 family)
VAISDVSAYWCDLDTVKARQTRYGGTGGGRGGEKPLPVDARFLGWEADGSRLQEAVKNTIGTWGRAVMEERPVLAGPTHDSCLHITCSTLRRSRPPRDDVASVCRYLLGQADWIRTQMWAPEILDELQDAAEQLRRMVDRPADKLFVGYCTECDTPLHAKIGHPMVKCVHCEKSFSVEASRQGMWEEAQDAIATASEIARAISWLGHESVTAERIRKWVERKRLERKGWLNVRGRELPTYRIGDVAALVEAASRTQKEAG